MSSSVFVDNKGKNTLIHGLRINTSITWSYINRRSKISN